jgi:predicted RNA-binding Zn ribbon-like protein
MSTETTNTEQAGTPEGVKPEGEQGQTFTQADVERIVKERLAQQAKNKFGDYEDLKTKAGNALTLEQRIADMEAESAAAKADALRARIAAEFGVSTKKGPKGEPSDADLFLTGADESTLTVQAQRLAAREEDRKKQGNFAPKEGTTTNSGNDNSDFRGVVKQLFSTAD